MIPVDHPHSTEFDDDIIGFDSCPGRGRVGGDVAEHAGIGVAGSFDQIPAFGGVVGLDFDIAGFGSGEEGDGDDAVRAALLLKEVTP